MTFVWTPMLTRPELAKRVYELSNLRGKFKLRSGAVSDQYFDKYRFESYPAVLREVVGAMVALLPEDGDVLAGLELGGIPLATALSQMTGLPTAFVRKTTKEYGTRRLAEGARFRGRCVVIVEDVITTGGQVLESVTELRKRGARVSEVVCVIDREAGGAEKLSAEGLNLRALFTMTELRASAPS